MKAPYYPLNNPITPLKYTQNYLSSFSQKSLTMNGFRKREKNIKQNRNIGFLSPFHFPNWPFSFFYCIDFCHIPVPILTVFCLISFYLPDYLPDKIIAFPFYWLYSIALPYIGTFYVMLSIPFRISYPGHKRNGPIGKTSESRKNHLPYTTCNSCLILLFYCNT